MHLHPSSMQQARHRGCNWGGRTGADRTQTAAEIGARTLEQLSNQRGVLKRLRIVELATTATSGIRNVLTQTLLRVLEVDAAFPKVGEDLSKWEIGLFDEPPQRDLPALVPLERLLAPVLMHGAFEQSSDDGALIELFLFADTLDLRREFVRKVHGESRAPSIYA